MARLAASFASNQIAPMAVTVVEPITTQGAVRAAAKAAALQTESVGPAWPTGGSMGGKRPGPGLRRDGVLPSAGADSVAD